jgi:hypothetical protein
LTERKPQKKHKKAVYKLVQASGVEGKVSSSPHWLSVVSTDRELNLCFVEERAYFRWREELAALLPCLPEAPYHSLRFMRW